MFETIENAVKHLQAAQKEIADALDMAAIEALVVMIEVMLNQEDEEWATLSEEQRTAIVAMIDDAAFDGMTVELKRQVLQLLLVATMREDGLQANYQVTPDAIGMWVGAIVLSTGFLSAVGILEAVTERFSRVFSFEYGQARAWGSFGYAIVALLAGVLFVINPHLNFWFGSLFGVLLLLVLIFWVPKEERDANHAVKTLAREDSVPKLSDMLRLLKMSELWQVIIFIMFTWTFYNIFDSQMFPDFYTKLFSSVAVGQQTYGTLNSIQVFFEALMLGIVPIVMQKVGVKRTLMIGVAIMFLRIGLCGFNANPYAVSAIKMLHSLEVPMFTLSIFRYFTLHFNTKLSASLYMIGFQIAAQIGQVILSTPLGILRDRVGYQNTFHVIAVIVLIAGVYAFFILKKDTQHVDGTPLAKS